MFMPDALPAATSGVNDIQVQVRCRYLAWSRVETEIDILHGH